MRHVAKVINRHKGLTLVEWLTDGALHRAWVTPDMITTEGDASVEVESPETGIPYGVTWSRLISANIDLKQLEAKLRNAGIWTVEDLQANPKKALGVLQLFAGDKLSELLASSRAYQKDAQV